VRANNNWGQIIRTRVRNRIFRKRGVNKTEKITQIITTATTTTTTTTKHTK